MTLAVNVAMQPTPRVAETRPDVPAILDDLVARAMAKDPATRYASAAELHEALVRVRETLTGKVPKPLHDLPRISRRKVLMGVGVIVALAIVSWLMFGGPCASLPAIGPGTVAIPPVINASTDQTDLDELGSLMQSVLSRNLAAVPGITIVPAPLSAPTGQTASPGQSPPKPPDYTVSVTIRRWCLGSQRTSTSCEMATPVPGGSSSRVHELALLGSVLDWLATVGPATSHAGSEAVATPAQSSASIANT